MPKYRVQAQIIEDYTLVIEAEDEMAARDVMWREINPDVGPDQYAIVSSREIE